MGDLIKLKGLKDFVFRRYSDYEIRVFEEKEYVVPCSNAVMIEFDPFEIIDDLIIDYLKLGKVLYEKEGDSKSAILDFCRKYGLLGFINSFCHNRELRTHDIVLVSQNAPTKRGKQIETGEYLRWFFPFGEPEYIETGRVFADFYISDTILFCPNYAERLSWISRAVERQYTQMWNMHNYTHTPGRARDAFSYYANSFEKDNSGFSITMTDKPEFVWHIRSLHALIATVFALEVTLEKPKLKLCKTCFEPFIAKNPKAEFCSKKCGNRMHVRNFRR